MHLTIIIGTVRSLWTWLGQIPRSTEPSCCYFDCTRSLLLYYHSLHELAVFLNKAETHGLTAAADILQSAEMQTQSSDDPV